MSDITRATSLASLALPLGRRPPATTAAGDGHRRLTTLLALLLLGLLAAFWWQALEGLSAGGSLLPAAVASAVAAVAFRHLAAGLRQQTETSSALAVAQRQNEALIRQLADEKNRAFQLAYYDQLTGLVNRHFFRLMATDRLLGSRRRRKDSAVLFIDLDRFKPINDQYGHQVGDRVLVEVARRLRDSLRSSDLVARFGGDEFLVQIIDVDTVDRLDLIAEKLTEVITAPIETGGLRFEVSPSIGIAVCPRDGDTVELLIRNADAAMYDAKRAGRGVTRYFDAQLNAKLRHYANLEQGLRAGITLGQFVLHYQPRVCSSGYKIVSLEALARWQHPEYGLVYPGDFIPLAEENGQIVELGAALLHRACAQIAQWRRDGLTVPPVAINVSARQLRDDGLLDLVRAAVAQAGIAYGDLEIEVTESCVMDDPEHAATILEQLVELGVRVSLDDYGTGYSNLSSIKRLPLHAIKIDRSFVADIGIDTNDDVIVASTISMCRGLRLRAVAEGVETREQLKRLRLLGCEELQGYLFGRPLSAAATSPLLARGTCPPPSAAAH